MTAPNPIKTLFILPALSAGGAERILVTLMNNIDRDKFAPELLTINKMGPIKAWIANDIPVHSLQERKGHFSLLKLIAFVKEHKPDIIFSTMILSNAMALIIKCLFPHIKVIVRETSLPLAILEKYGWKGRLCWFIYKFLYPKADWVLSNCSPMIEQFENDIKISTHNHLLLFNPVDTKRIFDKIPDQFDCPKDRKDTLYFVCLGRLSFEKGYDRLIRKLETFDPERPWKLDIVGEGDYRTKLEKLIVARGLEDHITLRGYHPNPWEIAARADCLLLPSRWEGMPNVVLEGFSCGLPTIAMREAGGIIDICACSPDDQLQIVGTMDEFIDAMKTIEIRPKKSKADSILPLEFSLPYVIEQFETILLSGNIGIVQDKART